MHAGSHGLVLYYASTQHALQHDFFVCLFCLMVTIVEVHKLIIDVCVSLSATINENFMWTNCYLRKGRGPIFELPHAGEKDAEHGSTRQISPATVFGLCSERYGGVLVTCVTSHSPRAGFEPLVCATESFLKSGSESNDSRSDRSASNQ